MPGILKTDIMKHVFLLMVTILFLTGCNYREREQALQSKEQMLMKKEEDLLAREQQLQLKESDLKQQAQRLDSSLKDTVMVYNQDLPGRWNVKMTCTETSCHGSAIGDSKSEVWEIYYSRRLIIAKVLDGAKLSRIYTGNYKDGQLELNEEVNTAPGVPNTQILVRLTLKDPKTMEGQREIIRTGDCRILYDLQLKKQ